MLLRSAAISALIAEVRSRGELLASAAIFIKTRIIRLRCSGSIGHRCVSARAIMRVSRMPIKRSGRIRTALLKLETCRVALYTLNALWVWLP